RAEQIKFAQGAGAVRKAVKAAIGQHRSGHAERKQDEAQRQRVEVLGGWQQSGEQNAAGRETASAIHGLEIGGQRYANKRHCKYDHRDSGILVVEQPVGERRQSDRRRQPDGDDADPRRTRDGLRLSKVRHGGVASLDVIQEKGDESYGRYIASPTIDVIYS